MSTQEKTPEKDYIMTGPELRIIRETLGYSLQEIATIMHTTKQTLSLVERGLAKNKMTVHFYSMTIDRLAYGGVLDEKLAIRDAAISKFKEGCELG